MSDETVSDVQGTDDGDALGAQEAVVEDVTEVDAVEVPEPVQPEPAPTPVAEDTPTDDNPPGLEQEGKDDAAEPKGEADADKERTDRKLTRENQALRKRLREAEEKVREFEEAQLSEQERQQKRLAELEEKYSATEARLREASLNTVVTQEAVRLNVVDPEAVIRLLDRGELEYDAETNTWSGVPDAVAMLVEDKPYLVKQDTPAPPKESAPANPARRRTRLTREALKSMSDAEIAALPWDDVHAALSES